jgi:hypothetical protein
MLSKDLNQIVYSFLPLEEAYKMPDINIGTYCKYTKIEDRTSMEDVSRAGHIEVLKYLHEVVGAKCTVWAMNCASRNGHIEVVNYLHEVVGAECTTCAMDWASRDGHIKVVKYLHEVAGANY